MDYPKIDLERIDFLITEEIAAVISEEDLAYLHWAISVDETAYRMREEKRAKLCKPEVMAEVQNNYNPEQILQNIPKPRNRALILEIAAVLLLGIILLYKKPQQAIPSPVNSNTVRLILPGGKEIDLSNTEGTLKTGSVILQTNSKTLSYSDTNTSDNRQATLTVPPGKDYRITLDDGTEVSLNATSRLTFPLHFNGKTRKISINGEAFLKIAAHADRPFIVQLSGSTIHVLGTAFNINNYDTANIKVSLLEGKVRLHHLKESVVLQTGQEALIRGNNINTQSFDRDYTLSWLNGIYAFNNSSLSEILEVLPRWFNITLKIENPGLSKKRFTGIIDRNQPLKNSLEALKMASSFNYAIEGDVVRIW